MSHNRNLSPKWLLDQHSESYEGFPFPDWDRIDELVGQNREEDWLHSFWTEIGKEWIGRVHLKLGEKYHIRESDNFVLLSAEDSKTDTALLNFAEEKLARIKDSLRGIVEDDGFGKHAIFVFASRDEYWSYVSYFYPDGDHSGSSGTFLNAGYAHIALAPAVRPTLEAVLLHELLHSCLTHLSIPLWIEEGLTQLIEVACNLSHPIAVEADLLRHHQEIWGEAEIRSFWSGESWRDDDYYQASYELSEILMTLIISETKKDRDRFTQFICKAHFEDAGEAAALEHLGKSLADYISGFLGPGEWKPQKNSGDSSV